MIPGRVLRVSRPLCLIPVTRAVRWVVGWVNPKEGEKEGEGEVEGWSGEGWSGGCGRSVPSHQKLLNPCIDALHGLLNEKRVGRVQTAVAVSKKPTSYSVVVCGPGL